MEENKTEVRVTHEAFTNRFQGADWFNSVQRPIILAGVGGIGSWTALLLSRLGAKLILYDPDTFTSVNLAGQLISTQALGQRKVSAIASIIEKFAGTPVTSAISTKWQKGAIMENVAVCGFDNMKARKEFYEGWKKHVEQCPPTKRKECLFIDGRLAAESLQIFTIRGFDIESMKKYEKDYLFSDEEADATPCSYKQTSHIACLIAGLMVNQYTNFCANLVHGVPRPVRFYREYDAITGELL